MPVAGFAGAAAGVAQRDALVFSFARSPILGPAAGVLFLLLAPPAWPQRLAKGSAPAAEDFDVAGAAGLLSADMPDGVDIEGAEKPAIEPAGWA